MLIYNYQKEFLGIDEGDLKALGFSNLQELRNESADFADLFVKTPGFVHNFKHVHWIDFVTCAEGSEESKVIIHANGKSFRCILDIKSAYLVDDPSQKAYIVNLVNLRALTHNENEQVAGDVLEKPAPRVATTNTAIFNTPEFSGNFQDDKSSTKPEPVEEVEVTHDPYEVSSVETIDELDTNSNVVEDIYEDAPIDLGDELLEVEETQNQIDEIEVEEEAPQVQEKRVTVVPTQVLNVGSDYVYDPHLASDELGLPVDLIEEFIQDFISQADEFKEDLYSSLEQEDIDHVKILSHKLKGVAANLRIEDAFEVLTTINSSDDTDEIKTNIDTFYIIIEKLSNKNFQKTEQEAEETLETFSDEVDEEDDDLILSFKDETEDTSSAEQITEDVEVPQKIEMPELADDDFSTIEIDEEEDIELELDEIKLDQEELNEAALTDESKNSQETDLENIEELTISTLDYDKTVAANEIGIDAQTFNEFFEDYTKESAIACDNIKEAIENNQPQAWKKCAINLKGMSDNMRIHDFTSELESIIHTQDAEVAKVAIDSISNMLQQISSKEV